MTEQAHPVDREAILESAIRPYALQGWLVQNRTGHSAQLTKPAEDKNGCLILVLLLFGILPGILYLLLPRDAQTLLIEVDTDGIVRENGRIPRDQTSASKTKTSNNAIAIGIVLAIVLLCFLCWAIDTGGAGY